MGTGIGINCKCCEKQLNYDEGFNREKELCNTCEFDIIPMVLKYIAELVGES